VLVTSLPASGLDAARALIERTGVPMLLVTWSVADA
jgi:hypothetical protein